MPSIRLAAGCIFLLAACSSTPQEYARAYRIERMDQAIGGPSAIARPGDLLLENDRIRVAILASELPDGTPRNSMGPGLYGGSLVDADLQWGDARFGGGRGNDQFMELFPTASMNVLRPVGPDAVRILADGSDGGAAVVRVQSAGSPFLNMLGALWAVVRQPDMVLVHDYIAEPGVPWLTLQTTVVFGWDGTGEVPESVPAESRDDTMPVIDWAVTEGVVLGDFYLSGGNIDVFMPGEGFDEDLAVFEAQQRGDNLFLEPFAFPFLAGLGEGISYGIAPVEGQAFIPLFTSSQTAVMGAGQAGDGSRDRFPDGTALSYTRWFFVGTGDVGSVLDQWLEATEQPFGQVSGHVVEEATLFALSGADVLVFEPGAERPFSQWRTDVDPRDDRRDGSFSGRLPPGEWELMVHVQGRPDSERVTVDVSEGGEAEVTLASPRPGLLSFTIRDERGRRVPAKLSIFPVGRAPSRSSVFGDGYIAGAPEAVLFSLRGDGEVALPDGEYTAVASRGIEYELHVTDPFVIDAAHRQHLDLQVVRSVQTDGWVSADLHVHSAPSHDSGVARADRVLTMVAEGVEFFVSADHDHLTDFAPTIEDLGMEEWLGTAVGNETTTVEIGHYIGFPLAESFTGDAGGAFDWTGMAPEEIVDELRAAGVDAGYDPAVFVAHPRAGILGLFDQYGFDPYDGMPGVGGGPGQPAISVPTLGLTNPLISEDLFTLDFDALELMGTKDLYYVRTPTQPELDRMADDGSTTMYDILERTAAEQQGLSDGVFRFGFGHEGQIEDWFTLLNLGYRHTALANSDTHSWTTTEAGCPRNFIASSTDDPAFIDAQEMADAVRDHRVIASYGPFVRLWVEGEGIGGEVAVVSGPVEVQVEVQAPSWIDLDRVELYLNGSLVAEIEVTGDDPLRVVQTLEVEVTRDSWFVAMAMGDGDLAPVFTPVEVPNIPLDEVVLDALAGIDAVQSFLSPSVPIPRIYPVHPFGLTNPVWVDVGGDGWQAPGLPDWLEPPIDPEE